MRALTISAVVFVLLNLGIRPASSKEPYAYTMTGQMLVDKLFGDGNDRPVTGEAYLEREKAYSYMDGLKDATEGTVWCHARNQAPVDFAMDTASALSKLDAAQRRANAAPLVLEILSRKYPCPSKRGDSK